MLAHVLPLAGWTTQVPACCGWAKQQEGRCRSLAAAIPVSARKDKGNRIANAIVFTPVLSPFGPTFLVSAEGAPSRPAHLKV
jgi:hypothetical protein